MTRLNRHEYTPEQAMNVLRPFLNRYYPGKWKKKGRSVGIEMGKVKLDVVLTSAPSEALERSLIKAMQQENDYGDTFDTGDEWRNEPLWIPDREAKNWQRTHPREQIRWTQEKNRRTNGHYIHVVKLVKWWWQTQHPEQEHPRSYPLEHIVGDCCPDGVTSLAQAFTETMERIARYNPAAGSPDRGVPEQNVLKRITMADASRFQQFAVQAAAVARRACNSKDERRKREPVAADFRKQVHYSQEPERIHPPQSAGSDKGQPVCVVPIKGSALPMNSGPGWHPLPTCPASSFSIYRHGARKPGAGPFPAGLPPTCGRTAPYRQSRTGSWLRTTAIPMDASEFIQPKWAG